ncbi:putative quinol monooxygenase [Aquimarina sp. W85]|uniref:putative quinol monooxygenase n=1 Tax=Aquimarina rhodophyticola TaxID=3342246 RepID=UPI0036734427
MIIRIVKMGFKTERIDEFLAMFVTKKEQIRGFDGCTHLKLIRDIHNPDQFFTYSHWESQEHLDAYRASALFKDIWANTKKHFNQKPEAWSGKEY